VGENLKMDKKFTGQTLDRSTGLYWYASQAHDAGLGRFVQPDTVVPEPGNPQSLNRYSYVLNNPLKYTDPTGDYVMFIGGVGTSNDPKENLKAWGFLIEQLGLKEGEYGFFDWPQGSFLPWGLASSFRPLGEVAAALAEQIAGKTDITLIGHSRGGALVMEYLAQVAEGRLGANNGGAWLGWAGLRRYEEVDVYRGGGWVYSTVRDRLADLPAAVAAATGGAMSVEVAVIANVRDPISAPLFLASLTSLSKQGIGRGANGFWWVVLLAGSRAQQSMGWYRATPGSPGSSHGTANGRYWTGNEGTA
jgi:RHS repeat-associated protein